MFMLHVQVFLHFKNGLVFYLTKKIFSIHSFSLVLQMLENAKNIFHENIAKQTEPQLGYCIETSFSV